MWAKTLGLSASQPFAAPAVMLSCATLSAVPGAVNTQLCCIPEVLLKVSLTFSPAFTVNDDWSNKSYSPFGDIFNVAAFAADPIRRATNAIAIGAVSLFVFDFI